MSQAAPGKKPFNVANFLGIVVFAVGLFIYLRMHPPGADASAPVSTWRPPADFTLQLSDVWTAQQPEEMMRLNGIVTYEDDHGTMIYVSRYPRSSSDTAATFARSEQQGDSQNGKARVQSLTVCGQPGRLVHSVSTLAKGQISDTVIVADKQLIYEFDLLHDVDDPAAEIAPALHAIENVCFVNLRTTPPAGGGS